MDSIITQTIFAGIGIAISAAILGCFVVWRKMSYFADSLAHSSLLGIALGLMFGINLEVSMLVIALIFSVLLLILEHKQILSSDSLLGVLSYGFLSLAIIALFSLNLDIDLHAYLFGDILALNTVDIYLIYIMLSVIFLFIFTNLSKMTLITISKDSAKAEGINVLLFNIVFMLLLAFFVVLSVRLIGALLIGAMLIIPAATSRFISPSMNIMLGISIIFGVIATLLGIWTSLYFDTPTGPTIVAISSGIFLIFFLLNTIKK